ncbi:MAG: metalloregulator ArsR/SmtB family transcription factor [Phycisphaerae bacterium]
MQPETIFKAMADRTRQRALGVLRRRELSVSELVEVLHQPQSTVSRHLKVLRDTGLIQDRRDGNTVLYSVPPPVPEENGTGLTTRLLEWIAEQPLARSIESRLEAVIQSRRDMSRRFFDRIGHQWDALREESFGSSFHLEAFLALLPRDWTVADVGTGTGYLLPTLARHFERVIGVEPVETMLDAARHRTEHHRIENVELRKGDLAHLPITEAAVDLAIAVLVLHHVPTPREAIAELQRIVCPGGRVLIVEQTAHQNEIFRDRMQDRWWGFDPAEFGGLLESVGFEEVESRRLVTAPRASDDAPDLFVVTGRKTRRNRD